MRGPVQCQRNGHVSGLQFGNARITASRASLIGSLVISPPDHEEAADLRQHGQQHCKNVQVPPRTSPGPATFACRSAVAMVIRHDRPILVACYEFRFA